MFRMEPLSIGHFDVAFEQILVILEFGRAAKIKMGFFYHYLSTSSNSLTSWGRNITTFPRYLLALKSCWEEEEEKSKTNLFWIPPLYFSLHFTFCNYWLTNVDWWYLIVGRDAEFLLSEITPVLGEISQKGFYHPPPCSKRPRGTGDGIIKCN